MRIFYFILLLVATLFFNACAPTHITYSAKQIDTFAIPPSKKNNLFSPPKNGYARIIMYRDDYNIGFYNEIFVTYRTRKNIIYELDRGFWSANWNIIGGMDDSALCKLDNDSSCIVNIKAGKPVLLLNKYEATTSMNVFRLVLNILQYFVPPFYPTTASATANSTQGTIFTPKNQHIYCFAIKEKTGFVFKNRNTCLKEYKESYKPEHREEQVEWLNELVDGGDERAYKE